MKLEEIGYRIKRCRKAKKMTQERLAEMIDVSPHYIYEIERGTKTMSLNILIRLSDTLNVSTDYLLLGKQMDHEQQCMDHLDAQIHSLPSKNRDIVANILSDIIPHLK